MTRYRFVLGHAPSSARSASRPHREASLSLSPVPPAWARGCQAGPKRGGGAPAPTATAAAADLSDRFDRMAREAGHERWVCGARNLGRWLRCSRALPVLTL